jgi:hypothetical protein
MMMSAVNFAAMQSKRVFLHLGMKSWLTKRSAVGPGVRQFCAVFDFTRAAAYNPAP